LFYPADGKVDVDCANLDWPEWCSWLRTLH
jgi:hypothetical protein